eukprot:1678356-Rhodomonas_salina.3
MQCIPSLRLCTSVEERSLPALPAAARLQKQNTSDEIDWQILALRKWLALRCDSNERSATPRLAGCRQHTGRRLECKHPPLQRSDSAPSLPLLALTGLRARRVVHADAQISGAAETPTTLSSVRNALPTSTRCPEHAWCRKSR